MRVLGFVPQPDLHDLYLIPPTYLPVQAKTIALHTLI
jgi:hypothetical protein